MQAVTNEKSFAFIKQSRPYICLQQSPLLFAWLFLTSHKSLKLNELGLKKNTGFRGVKAIVRHHISKNNSGRAIWLPAFGHLALKVHRGYKIFDFKRSVVTRIIDPDVADTLVKEEIFGVVTAAELQFAPKVFKRDEKQRLYEEEYIIGEKKKTTDTSGLGTLFHSFEKQIAPCLEDMQSLKTISQVEKRSYLSHIMRILDDSRLFETGVDRSKLEEIRFFLSSIVNKLIEESVEEIFVAFSHGDFSLVNMLTTPNGIKVIDWEGARNRGLLNDFFNYFMTEIYYDRAEVDIAEEVNKLGNNILRKLQLESVSSKESYIKVLSFYRNLYYVERVIMLLEREITDKSLNVISKSIDVFKRFENKCEKFAFSEDAV